METKEPYPVEEPVETKLARLMLEYGDQYAKVKALEAEITQIVLALGKTQVVGRVRATYSNGRNYYDYQWAADAAYRPENPKHLLIWGRHIKESFDYRAICDELGILDKVPCTTSPPAVSVRVT